MEYLEALDPITLDPPKTRLVNATNALRTAKDLEESDPQTDARTCIYKCYHRFPPTEYSELLREGMSTRSNVCFGELAMTVDETHASYHDMISERSRAADITFRSGQDPRVAVYRSNVVSEAWDKTLRQWPGYWIMNAGVALNMLLFGKGVAYRPSMASWRYDFLATGDLKVPVDAKVDLSNVPVLAIRWSYSQWELFEKVRMASSSQAGWNRALCLEAIMNVGKHGTSSSPGDYEQYVRKLAGGETVITGSEADNINVWEMYVREFDGSITKLVVWDSSGAVIAGDNDSPNPAEKGFLFFKENYAQDWPEILTLFTDSTGENLYHNITSLAEKIYIQCRNSDRMLNEIMDAVSANMMLLLQGGDSASNEKLRAIKWETFTALPPDMVFTQHRFALPVEEAVRVNSMVMNTMLQGTGKYRRIPGFDKGGGDRSTATQKKLEAAQSAQLDGTQLRRFNESHTVWNNYAFRALLKQKAGVEGESDLKFFKRFCEDRGIDPETIKEIDIESIESNMIAGAGNPQYRLMAATETVNVLNITPRDEGQAEAIKEVVAVLQGRQNVPRFFMEKQQDPVEEVRRIGWENELLKTRGGNPSNVVVLPTDPHIVHLGHPEVGHIVSQSMIMERIQQALESGEIKIEDETENIMSIVMSSRAVINHCIKHLQILIRDKSKEKEAKAFAYALQEISGKAENLETSAARSIRARQEKGEGVDKGQMELMIESAKQAIILDTQRKLADLKLQIEAEKAILKGQLSRQQATAKIAEMKASAIVKNAAARKPIGTQEQYPEEMMANEEEQPEVEPEDDTEFATEEPEEQEEETEE